MFTEPARILRPSLPAGRRTVVMSDIHGNLPYFDVLLERLSFSRDDILILAGDFLEKGPDSLGMLRRIMQLSKEGNVYPVLGNCDEWQLIFGEGTQGDEHLRHYLTHRRHSLLGDMLGQLGYDPCSLSRISDVFPQLQERFAAEWAFLSSLPHALETENFIFVHAGMSSEKPLDAHTVSELTRRPAFLREGQSFPKWVVVGHWPCVLYHESYVDANPILDREQHIVSLDGGCVLKDDGQLNALILPDLSDPAPETFSFAYYDPFPSAEVLEEQEESSSSYYIRWGDSEVQVLERGEEFSRCRHVRTGYEMDILTKYLFTGDPVTGCNDCSDYRLPLCRGDRVDIIERTSRGFYVKHNGVSGWYLGALKEV